MSSAKFPSLHLRSWLLAFAMVPLGAVPAWAADDDDDEAKLDRVEVTGSRIRRTDVEGVQPIVSLSRADLERSGMSSVGEVLQALAVSGSALNTKFNSSGNFGFPPDGGGVGAGSTQVDLRHLDAKRVLVLVDGKRWVNESSASGVGSATDLNTIPMAIIERIEVLKDGASTIYGSDAIAGVVNIITRKEFEGVDARMYRGEYNQGDGTTEAYELSMGKSDSRSSVFFSLSYTDQALVSSGDRSISQEPVPGTGVTRGSSATPQGRFIFFNGNNTAGGLCPLIDTDGDNVGDTAFCNITTPRNSSFAGGVPTFPNSFIGFSTAERFNFAPYNLMLTPSERSSAFLSGRYALTDTVDLYARFLHNNRRSLNRAAPEPIFLGPDAGNGTVGDTVSIDVTNPFNPFNMTLDPTNLILIGRRPLEGGPRLFGQSVNTNYFGTGLQGSLEMGDGSWDWDVNYIFSRNQANQTTRGTYNIAHIVRGLGPVGACNADPHCVPLNIFGGQNGGTGTLTQPMLDYILATLHDESEQELRSYTANLSGALFDLPAGPLGVAVGYEHRTQSGFYQPDHLVVSGESNGVPSLPTSGRYSVTEYYGELVVPLFSDLPMMESFEVEASMRASDYDTSGSDTTSRFGVRWRVSDGLLVRATASEGFRAPSIGELFGSASRFDAVISDPCSDFNNSGAPAQTVNNCVALGVPSNGSYTQANPQISVTTGGNALLSPETSDSFTAGLVWSSSFMDGVFGTERLDFEATYYRHELAGAIQAIDAQTQLDLCVQSLDPTACNGITRNANGAIVGFNNRLLNIGGIDTEGWDFSVIWRSEDTDWGRFGFDWHNAFVGEFIERSPTGTIDLVGIERTDSGIPEWSSTLAITWQRDAWSGAWNARMTGELMESCSDFLDGTPNSLTALGLCSHPDTANEANSLNRLGTTVYHDVQLSYDLDGAADWTLTFGVNNLFDKRPPICVSCSLNGYDASNYDIPGRFPYVRIVARFE